MLRGQEQTRWVVPSKFGSMERWVSIDISSSSMEVFVLSRLGVEIFLRLVPNMFYYARTNTHVLILNVATPSWDVKVPTFLSEATHMPLVPPPRSNRACRVFCPPLRLGTHDSARLQV